MKAILDDLVESGKIWWTKRSCAFWLKIAKKILKKFNKNVIKENLEIGWIVFGIIIEKYLMMRKT